LRLTCSSIFPTTTKWDKHAFKTYSRNHQNKMLSQAVLWVYNYLGIFSAN
jgi:hypothetical protein